MKNVIAGAAGCSNSPAPTLHLGTYRRALLAVIIGNPLFTDAEQVLANHNAHACQDAQRLALWTRNSLRVAKEREAQAAPTGNLLANLANPAYVAQHGSKQAAAGFPTLTVADAYKAAESLRQAFAAAQQQPFEPTAPAAPATPMAWATPAQCDEIFALACQLPAAERGAALNRLPLLSKTEAAAFLRGLQLRLTHGRGASVALAVPAQQWAAAATEYVKCSVCGRLVPLPVGQRRAPGQRLALNVRNN